MSEIAKDLNRTFASVACKAQVLGLKISRAWSQEEIDYVRDNLNLIPIRQIAKELFRSVEAVREMMKLNGLRVTDEIEITIKEVCRDIGLDYYAVYEYIRSGEMKIIDRLVCASRSYIFDMKDLRDLIFRKFTYKTLLCHTCKKEVVGDLYCEDHIPYGEKKKPVPKKEFKVPIKDKNFRPKLREALMDIRNQNQLTQEEVSDLCGYGSTWYGIFERLDKPMITLDQLVEVLTVMGFEYELTIKRKDSK